MNMSVRPCFRANRLICGWLLLVTDSDLSYGLPSKAFHSLPNQRPASSVVLLFF